MAADPHWTSNKSSASRTAEESNLPTWFEMRRAQIHLRVQLIKGPHTGRAVTVGRSPGCSVTGVEEGETGMATFDPMGDLSIRQPHHDSPPQPPHPLLHQLVDPFDHGVDPSRAEHDERDPIAHVDPRRLPGLMRHSLYLHRLREPPERGWSCVSCSKRSHAF